MSILLFHGVPGSFKTTWAVYEGLIPAWKAGKRIITNVRGLTQERCIAMLGETGAEVINETSETEEGLKQWQRFFHHAPKEVLFIIDEVQTLYPTTIGKRDWAKFDYTGTEDWRPRGVLEAFQKHRHLNWDFYFTSQDMRQIHLDIRMIIEGCWRHTNQGTVGVSGYVLREYHTPSHPRVVTRKEMVSAKSVGKVAWPLYDSTATGQTSDTIVNASIFKSIKLWILFILIAGGLIYVVNGILTWSSRHEKNNSDSAENSTRPAEVSGHDATSLNKSGGSSVAYSKARVVLPLRPYEGYNFYVLGGYAVLGGTLEYIDDKGLKKTIVKKQIKAKFLLYSDDLHSNLTIDYEDLYNVGYRFQIDGRCAMRLYFGGVEKENFIQHIACYQEIEPDKAKPPLMSNVNFPSFGATK
ncbi:zonular occludens toxin family protein [Beggiatoa leptomitoformis]|uniref:Zona occludens toxin N-terminal domain-containing protein n=1 Tax=Beggiatoa leptomitoformis TaxID=288004 RepID=A0A2N9YBN8_9GAMM|nr:zonular occludens toxin domain-containing protein [Beggiatoa leptomitoformis]ALG66770.1 hypothetical protein AL038_02385 [Beggiatoa leptomitoformis]AUI67885.1 hypothetical protein BLE401_03655 [Beggiatoa leptomitoformis]